MRWLAATVPASTSVERRDLGLSHWHSLNCFLDSWMYLGIWTAKAVGVVRLGFDGLSGETPNSRLSLWVLNRTAEAGNGPGLPRKDRKSRHRQ